MAKELGVECTYIPNGLDFEKFGLDTPTTARNPKQVMMLYHTYPVKGSADGLQALRIVRERVPDLRVLLFGTPVPNGDIPHWMNYHRLPHQSELRACYNRTAIFVSPSRTEGWPLPPAEAMLCGAALAATDIGGHREYAVHEQNALLSSAGDPEKLAANIFRLIRDQELRNRLAIAGQTCARQFSWDKAVNSFEELLKEHHQLRRDIVGWRSSLATAGS
jgi:glycosyltransferase involved in cell wall biosynthesis